jgi:putative ABC transport system permease protein
MILFDIKIALRNIRRNKVQSAISILGLGIGLGCIILLLALIVHEKSFDRYIPGYENVYRILLGNNGTTQYPVAEEMKGEFPEVKDFFRYYEANEILIRNKDNSIVRDQDFGFADKSIFQILGIDLVAGSPATSSSEVTISERTALKYFGNISPVGSIITVSLNDEYIDLNISGIYRDFPSNSTLDPAFIADIKLSEKMFRQFQRSLGAYGNEDRPSMGWESTGFLSYVVLEKNTDINGLASKMGKYKEFIANDTQRELDYSLQPVSDIYLAPEEVGRTAFLRIGNREELRYYEVISFLILMISVTNYILLTRAGAGERFRELGTRKILDASGNLIRRQIIIESTIVAIISLIPALFVIDLGIPFIDNTLQKTLGPEVFSRPVMWLLFIFVILFTGTVSGLLIGFNISKIPSLVLLGGNTTRFTGSGGKWRYSFLVMHFSIYLILVCGVITVSKQIRYSMTHFTGIHPENVIVSDLSSAELQKSFSSICNEIEKIPGVIMTAGGSYIPPMGVYLPITLANTAGERIRFDGVIMGERMTELLGIKIIDGEPFGMFSVEKPEVLLNESAARENNVKAGEKFLGFNVKGIVEDFHAHSLHRSIQPMVILQQVPERMRLIAIKTDGKNDEAVRRRLIDLCSEISPGVLVEPSYLSDRIEAFYSGERDQEKIIGAFSLLAMVLSVMGLFGIALITIAKRTKEIGIRKVNGAAISEVVFLLNTGFLKWVLIAIVISIPASVFLMSKWLDRFAYKTELSWWIFALSGIIALGIALLTVSWQSWKAATRNPVEALRYE